MARRVTARKGSLTTDGFSAREYKGGRSVFKGRIAVRRSGLTEFPSPAQFPRIAREEGIPKTEAVKAFGHMPGYPGKKKRASKKRTSKKRARKRTSKKRPSKRRRRTSRTRTKPGFFSRLLAKNTGRRTVRRGLLATADGEFRAEEYLGDDPVFAGRVMLDRGSGLLEFPTPEQLIPLARKAGFTQGAVKQAFGHMMGGALPSEAQVADAQIPTTYGPRRMKIGHYVEGAGARPGVARGQLVLYDRQTGAVVWRAFAIEEGRSAGKIRVNNRVMALSRALKSALDRNIPPLAFLQAFGYLVNPDDLRRLYAQFS